MEKMIFRAVLLDYQDIQNDPKEDDDMGDSDGEDWEWGFCLMVVFMKGKRKGRLYSNSSRKDNDLLNVIS